jgi:hypothetical protein
MNVFSLSRRKQAVDTKSPSSFFVRIRETECARRFFGAGQDFLRPCAAAWTQRMICNTIIQKIKDKIYGFLCTVYGAESAGAFNAFFVCHFRLFVRITQEKCDIKSLTQAFLSGDTVLLSKSRNSRKIKIYHQTTAGNKVVLNQKLMILSALQFITMGDTTYFQTLIVSTETNSHSVLTSLSCGQIQIF